MKKCLYILFGYDHSFCLYCAVLKRKSFQQSESTVTLDGAYKMKKKLLLYFINNKLLSEFLSY